MKCIEIFSYYIFGKNWEKREAGRGNVRAGFHIGQEFPGFTDPGITINSQSDGVVFK